MTKNRNYYGLLLLVIIAILIAAAFAGCAQQTTVATNAIPKTPAEAGIEILDSTSCEGCHTDAEAISAYEKPEGEGEVEEAGGG
ncbi:hypothetical protein MFMK1_002997 [Metallumcola ferriviriculae]|uniref:Cytochrome c domain-containing protein n=1 Tax=Metallumcola ferriviriculae TaxID=3039180 RepID=A0AAU0URG2_9FIRM|nr:hypothetical protein MFMK1_002997 [Desulfitibacteraceae bacterium MK1]